MDDSLENVTAELAELAQTNLKEFTKKWFYYQDLEIDRSVESIEDMQDFAGFAFVLVDENGGREGEGDHADKTFAVVPVGSDQTIENGRVAAAIGYINFEGFYSSDYGTEWDSDVYVVTPVDVMVVQYHEVK